MQNDKLLNKNVTLVGFTLWVYTVQPIKLQFSFLNVLPVLLTYRLKSLVIDWALKGRKLLN